MKAYTLLVTPFVEAEKMFVVLAESNDEAKKLVEKWYEDIKNVKEIFIRTIDTFEVRPRVIFVCDDPARR